MSEMPDQMNAFSPARLFNSSVSNTDVNSLLGELSQDSSLKGNPLNGPVLGEGFSSSFSHRYLPNEHHRIVANGVGSTVNLTHWSESTPGLNTFQPNPLLFRSASTESCLDYVPEVLHDQYNGHKTNYSMHGFGSAGISCRPQVSLYRSSCYLNDSGGPLRAVCTQKYDGATSSEALMISDAYFDAPIISCGNTSSFSLSGGPLLSVGSSSSSNITSPPPVDSNMSLYFPPFFPQPDMQILRQPLPVSDSGIHSSVQGLCSGLGYSPQMMQPENYRSASLWPHPERDPLDCCKPLSNDQLLQEHQKCIEVKGSDILHSESNFDRSCKKNSNTRLEQVPSEPKLVNTMGNPGNLSASNDRNIRVQGPTEKDAIHGQAESTRSVVSYQKEQDVLLLYLHVKNCQNDGVECVHPLCTKLKTILPHMLHCHDTHCRKFCLKYKSLFNHFEDCHESTCPICMPVRRRSKEASQGVSSIAKSAIKPSFSNAAECRESSLKRMKTEHSSYIYGQTEACEVSPSTVNCNQLPCGDSSQPNQEHIMLENFKSLNKQPISEYSAASSPEAVTEVSNSCVEEPKMYNETSPEFVESAQVHSEVENSLETKASETGKDANYSFTLTTTVEDTGVKKGKQKLKSISLLNTFSCEQLRQHIHSLENCIVEDKAKLDGTQLTENLEDQNSCSLCGMNKLLFEPPPRYCASCYKHINPKGVYYCLKSVESMEYDYGAKVSFCGKCHSASGESIKVGGEDIRKANLERKMNYAETEAETEWWVQCDKCEAWQHQICALFNKRRKEAMHGEYICPNCCLQEIESGKRVPLARTTVLGAKDLPTTMLSDHIEQWLFRRLDQEREERANMLKKRIDEVPGTTGLTIRVVSSIDKKLEVNPLFYKIFEEEEYPTEFPYRSKVILLFQNIEGADVFLFGMYVQEYGSECPCPNQRRVCISYIDSVKYFRPEIKAVTGEALRTFVYHEILIGYLDYCKKQGFTSCYIWACPSVKQDYYILYCHPKIQKSPRPEKLRDWYQAMIRKAMKEKIILESNNLYENFFVQPSECKAKITSSRLPYFDSDFWPGKADILLKKEEDNESQLKGNKSIIQRALRAAKRDASSGKPKDILLMHQLGEIIRQIKEDFILIHLQHECNHCYQPLVSGKQWICNSCKKFQLCEQCYDFEQNLEKKDRHPITSREKHSFQLVELDPPNDIVDKDDIMQSDFFDLRTEFLNFCQANQYQFDSLRRAKHSTMMILYHLHNQTESGIASSCASCHGEIVAGGSWHCMTCTSYDICNSCYQKHGTSLHEHELISHATVADRTLLLEQGADTKASVQIALDALVHASNCFIPSCTYQCCLKVKRLFYHSRQCKARARGGCLSCKRIWHILQLHARTCKAMDCCVPRCKDLKNYMNRLRNCRQEAAAMRRIKQQEGEVSE